MQERSTASSSQYDWRLFALVLVGYVVVCWVYFGYSFGLHGVAGVDDAYWAANTVLDQYPQCLVSSDMFNPSRPLLAVSLCLTNKIFGANFTVFYLLPFVIYLGIALTWFFIVRNSLGLSVWLAFLSGLVVLSFPDNVARIDLSGASSLGGVLLTLVGVYLVLYFCDHPGRIVVLFIGCLAALTGFLMYELLIGLWAVGLPLLVLYKSRHLSSRASRRQKVRTILATSITFCIFAAWRVYLPRTYTEHTFILGGGALRPSLNIQRILSQLADGYGLLIRYPTRMNNAILTDVNAANLGRTILVALAVTLIVGVLLVMMARREGKTRSILPPETDNNPGTRRIRFGYLMFGFGLLSVPIIMLPYLLIDFDLQINLYGPLGLPFAASLLIMILLVLRRRWAVVALSIGTSALVFYATFYTAGLTAFAQFRSQLICDFLLRLTDSVPELPPGLFVISRRYIVSGTGKYEVDNQTLSNLIGMLYHQGPAGPGTYRYGVDGYNGYTLVEAPDTEIMPEGFKVPWPDDVQFLLHRFDPLPEVLPWERGFEVDYEPFQSLSLAHVPDGLITGSDSDHLPHQRAQQFCAWKQP